MGCCPFAYYFGNHIQKTYLRSKDRFFRKNLWVCNNSIPEKTEILEVQVYYDAL